MNVINIPDLFAATFGYQPRAIELPPAPPVAQQTHLSSPLYGRDALGMDYFLPVQLGGIDLPYPLIRISGRKTIVDTPLINRRGSVKELINIDDYRISIRGLIIGHDGNWPGEQIQQLRDLFERNEALPIYSALTDIFLITPDRAGFDKAVILSCDFPETRGAQNVCGYHMELVSDQELTLIVE